MSFVAVMNLMYQYSDNELDAYLNPVTPVGSGAMHRELNG